METGSWRVNMATGRRVRRLATAITEQEAVIARMAGSREDKDKEKEIGQSGSSQTFLPHEALCVPVIFFSPLSQKKYLMVQLLKVQTT